MKRGSIPPTFVFPAITVGVLALAFLYYYFPARTQRENMLNREAFRQLGTIADLVQNAVSNYGLVLERWALSPSKMEGFNDQVPDLKYVNVTPATPELRVGTRSDAGVVVLWFQYDVHGAEIPLGRVVQRFIRATPEENFDEFLVTDGNGLVLYQTRRTGLHLRNVSILLRATAGSTKTDDQAPAERTGAAQQASSMVKVSLGGADYRLYSCPTPILIHGTDAKPAFDLVLYGLVSEASVQKRALATPWSVLIAIILMVGLVAFVSWPLLKFRTMRASERVPRRAGLYFFLTSLVSVVLLIILMAHVRSWVSDFDLSREKLVRLADAIDANIADEVGMALVTISDATVSPPFLRAAANLRENPAACGTEDPTPYQVTEQSGSVLKWPELPVQLYPYFDQIFWADATGHQQIKWTVRGHPTPATRVCDFAFFTEMREGHLWHSAEGQPPLPPFRIDPRYSPNTGEYHALISTPYVASGSQPQAPIAMSVMVTQMLSLIHPVLPPGFGFAIVDQGGTVLFHSTAQSNGREQIFDETDDDPALRAAVFARTGGHLIANYHGNAHRFYVRPLRRIQGCPWTLVTFRDLRPLSAMQQDRTVLALALTVGYLLLVGIVAAFFIHMGEYPLDWLWPQAKMNGLYLHTAVATVAAAALLYVFLIRAPLILSFLAAAVAPVLALYAIAWKLQGRGARIHSLVLVLLAVSILVTALMIYPLEDRRWWQNGLLLLGTCACLRFYASAKVTEWIEKRLALLPAARVPNFAASYTAMALALLLLLPTLPCVSFLRVAHDYHENMFTRDVQLQTVSALQDREERVRQTFSKVSLADMDANTFVPSRIRDVMLDRYDTAFLRHYHPVEPPDLSPESHFWTPLQAVAAAGHDPYSAILRFLNPADTPNTRWNWRLEEGRYLHLHPRQGDPLSLSEGLVSELPALRPAFWEVTVALILLLALMYLLFRATVTRLFVLDVNFGDPWPETTLKDAVNSGRNLMLMGLPRAGKTEELEGLCSPGAIRYVDLAQQAPKWLAGRKQRFEELIDEIKEPVIVLDHFEFECHDPEINRVKLEFLERLAYKPDKRLVIVSLIDPWFYLSHGPLNDAEAPEGFAPGKYLERWMGALARFTLQRLKPPAAHGNGCYYRLLWAACSRSERVLLYQIARDGWPNRQNWKALVHLWKRGILMRTPVIRIVDDQFRDYICHVVGEKDVTIWERGESITVWDGVRIAFYVLILGLAVAISIYNQQQVLAVMTTVLGLASALAKPALDIFGARSGKAPDSTPKDEL